MILHKFNVSQTWLFINFAKKMHLKVAAVPYYRFLISASKNNKELNMVATLNIQLLISPVLLDRKSSNFDKIGRA